MEIVSIFDGRLYAFQYLGEADDELYRLLKLWQDMQYVREFLKHNQTDLPYGTDIELLALKIGNWGLDMYGIINDLATDESKTLDAFFSPLHNQEYRAGVKLSMQKGRTMELRLYALKVDQNLFVITGGAIKLTKNMQDRPHTQLELDKLARGRAFLNEQDIFDADSFEEFLIERYDD